MVTFNFTQAFSLMGLGIGGIAVGIAFAGLLAWIEGKVGARAAACSGVSIIVVILFIVGGLR